MRNIVLLAVVSIMSACASTFTGPITGTKYNVDVGGTSDMQQYRTEREEVICNKDKDKDKDKDKESQNVEQDCLTQEKVKAE